MGKKKQKKADLAYQKFIEAIKNGNIEDIITNYALKMGLGIRDTPQI